MLFKSRYWLRGQLLYRFVRSARVVGSFFVVVVDMCVRFGLVGRSNIDKTTHVFDEIVKVNIFFTSKSFFFFQLLHLSCMFAISGSVFNTVYFVRSFSLLIHSLVRFVFVPSLI